MSPSNQIPLRRVSLALLAIGTACLIAACGSSSSGTTSTSTVASASGSSASSFAARRTALVACLKKHGVTLPSRPPGAGGPGSGRTGTATGPRAGGVFFGGGGGGGRFRQIASNPKMQAAFKACGANFRFRAGRGFGRISHQAINDYVACVRQHGYNLPAPNFSGKASVFPANIRSNPKFQAASRSCQKLLIPPRSGSSSSGTTTAGA